MVVKLSNHSYIRIIDDVIGYITSQLTKADRVYNETGADFLKHISREPQEIETIVDKLVPIYNGVDRAEIKSDFIDFIQQLEFNHFVITADTVEGLYTKEIFFNYKNENPKIIGYDFSQGNEQGLLDTESFFYENFRSNPHLMDLHLEITASCNERCIHCYIPHSKKQQFKMLEYNKINEVINDFVSMGGLSVTVTGGEAFLHKDIDRILRLCKENDLIITILTNLTLLDSKHIRTLKEISPNLVQTSLYSMDPLIHDQITRLKGSFLRTKHNIELLISNNIPVQIACPVMKINKNCYKHVLKYAQSLNIKAHTDFIMMAQSDCNVENLVNRISLKETEELINEILNLDSDYRNIIETYIPRYNNPLVFKDHPICGVGMSTICLAENGDFYPCSGWQSFILGNAFSETLTQVWNNSERIRQLRRITNADFPSCLNCDARNFCSICLVRNFNENNGDMYKIAKHFCEVAHLNKRIIEDYKSN